VEWKEGSQTREITVVGYFTDPRKIDAALGGGIPGVGSLPGVGGLTGTGTTGTTRTTGTTGTSGVRVVTPNTGTR